MAGDETPEQRLEAWLEMWNKDMAHVSDVSGVLCSCIAESGRHELFLSAPEEVRKDLLETFEQVKAAGEFRIKFAHTGLCEDRTEEALTVIKILIEAGVLDASAAELATPAPFFIGLENLSGEAPTLAEFSRVAKHNHELIAAHVFSLSRPPFAYFGAAHALVGMTLEISRREYQPNGRVYTLEPVERAIARFEIAEPESDVITALASSASFIRSIRLQPTRRRRRTGFDLSMDWHDPPREILCQGLRLTSLEPVPVPPPGER